MIQIIAGGKGKGKTKILLDKVNSAINDSRGNVVYLDKNIKHMHELDKRVRLINVKDYLIDNPSEFIGFICGMISQDNDLEKVFLDSFLNIACVEGTDIDITPIINKLDTISAKFSVDFVISMSLDQSQMPDAIKDKVIVSL